MITWRVRRRLAVSLLPVALGAGLVACGESDATPTDGVMLPVAFGLPRDQVGLSVAVHEVSNPSSERFQRWLSNSEVASRFGAERSQAESVLTRLEASGFVGEVHTSGGLIYGAMPAREAERLFGVDLRITDIGEHTVIYPTGPIRVPVAFRDDISEVVGLSAAVGEDSEPWPRGGTVDDVCPTIPNVVDMLRAQYALPDPVGTELTGDGVTLAMLAVSAIADEAFDGLERCVGLDLPPVRTVAVDETPSSVFGLVARETTLDVSAVSMIAPGLDEIVMYQFNRYSEFVFPFAALTDDLGPDGPDIVSSSLGKCEKTQARASIDLMEWLLMVAAVNGVTVVSSSGDDGSSSCSIDRSTTTVQYPASSPYVTAVGGSQFTSTTALLDAMAEPTGFVDRDEQIVWNAAPRSLQAAGGGESSVFPVPRYQSGSVDGSMRVVPDVAFLASPEAYGLLPVCFASGECDYRQIGGTSASAPGFAAALAALSGAITGEGQMTHRLGLVNPVLYELGRSSPEGFDDIVTGNNDLYGVGCCDAAPGFDGASGWGSLNVADLVDLVR